MSKKEISKQKKDFEEIRLKKNIEDFVKNNAKEIKKIVKIDPDGKKMQIDVLSALNVAIKMPGVRIDRKKFFITEMKKDFDKKTIDEAIEFNPAYAGISVNKITKIANSTIVYERNKVSLISFAAGLPGGFAMIPAITCDLVQYFVHVLRIVQKLIYLYGFDELNFDENEIDSETMNKILIFVGAMYGVEGAARGIKILAQAVQTKVTKNLARVALTKTMIYPIIKKILSALGIRVTKQIFANAVGKIVPIIGGFVSGGLTFVTFGTNCNALKKTLSKNAIANPKTYKKLKEKK